MTLYQTLRPAATYWLRLPWTERWFTLKSVMLFGLLRLSLLGLSLHQLHRVLGWLATWDRRPQRAGLDERQRIVRMAVRLGAYFLPNRSCLTEALMVQLLFWRRGYPAELCIGVTKQTDGKLVAHAWVESEGQVVIGNVDNLARYARLPLRAHQML